ncbi:MAG: penicillin-binding transpeptidase domain-containing protein, partial [Myxococcota bacterium]
MRIRTVLGALGFLAITGVLVAQQSWRGPISASTGDGTKHGAISPSSTPPEPRRTEETDLLHRVQVDRMQLDAWRATAPAPNGHVAELTLDVDLQRRTDALWAKRGIPQGAALLLDLRTGRMLVYSAARTNDGQDPRTVADAPAASVFKVITAAALVERDKVKPSTVQCYRGGRSRIKLRELVPDEQRDRSCATVSEAMGQSLNTVFA